MSSAEHLFQFNSFHCSSHSPTTTVNDLNHYKIKEGKLKIQSVLLLKLESLMPEMHYALHIFTPSSSLPQNRDDKATHNNMIPDNLRQDTLGIILTLTILLTRWKTVTHHLHSMLRIVNRSVNC